MASCRSFISSELVRMQSLWQRRWDWPPLLSVGMAKDCPLLALHVLSKWRLSFCLERRDILPPSCLACVFDKINVFTFFLKIRFPTQIMFCLGWGKRITDRDIHLCLNLGNNSESLNASCVRKLADPPFLSDTSIFPMASLRTHSLILLLGPHLNTMQILPLPYL